MAAGRSYAAALTSYESFHFMSVMSNSSSPCGAGSRSFQPDAVPPMIRTCRLPTATHAAYARWPAGEVGALVHTNPGRLRM